MVGLPSLQQGNHTSLLILLNLSKYTEFPLKTFRVRRSGRFASSRARDLNIAVLIANRMWHADGSLHAAFHGFIGLLSNSDIDFVFMNELQTPLNPTLPVDQPYSFTGPAGTLGRDAGFLVHQNANIDPIPGIPDRSNLVWRIASTERDSAPVAMASFWAPHVGCSDEERTSFWTRMHASICVVKARFPQSSLLIAGDANLWVPGLVRGRGARPGDRAPLAQLRAIPEEFHLEIANPAECPTHSAGAALDLIIASPGLLAAAPQVHNGQSCACQNRDTCCPELGSDHFLLTAPLSSIFLGEAVQVAVRYVSGHGLLIGSHT